MTRYFNGINLDIVESPGSPAKVLDFGCGNGEISVFFLRRAASVTSVDIDETAQGKISASLDASELSRFTFIALDADRDELPSQDRYDLIVCREVIEHVRNPQRLIHHFHSILRQDGIAVISAPSYFSEKFFSLWDRKWLAKSGHVSVFKKGDMLAAFNKAKFSLVRLEGGSFKWFLFWTLLSPFKVDHRMGTPIGHERKVSLALELANRVTSCAAANSLGNRLLPKSNFYYLKKYKPRILVIYDYHDWILGRWAANIANLFGDEFDIVAMSMFHAMADAKYTERLARRCDLIHLLLPHCYDFFRRVKGDAALITTIHHWIDWNEVKDAAHGSDALLTVARQWKEKLISKGIDGSRIAMAHSGVEDRFFADAPPLIAKDDKFTIGFFSKLDSNEADRKGTRHFQEIIRLISERGMAGCYRIVIAGPGWDGYLAGIAHYGMELNYLGFVADELMPSLYKSLDAYLMLSDIEGGPVTVPEAMASGCLVITTDIGVSRDIIDDNGNGIVVDTAAPGNIVDLLERLRLNREEVATLSGNGYRYACERMTYKETFKPIRKLYGRLTAGMKARNDVIDVASINARNGMAARSVNGDSGP